MTKKKKLIFAVITALYVLAAILTAVHTWHFSLWGAYQICLVNLWAFTIVLLDVCPFPIGSKHLWGSILFVYAAYLIGCLSGGLLWGLGYGFGALILSSVTYLLGERNDRDYR